MPFVQQRSAGNLLEEGSARGPGRGAGSSVGRGAATYRKSMPRADVVMVLPYKTDATVKWGDAAGDEELRGMRPPNDAERHKMETWQIKRQGTLSALSDSGLVLMLYYSRDRDEIFVKIAADEQHLRQVAEVKRHKLELKPQYLSAFAEYRNDYVGRRELGYSDRCVVAHLYKSHVDETDADGGEKYPRPDAIFRTTDRIQLIDYVLRSSGHGCAGVDIGQLMHDRDVVHYFPLHEPAQLRDLDQDWFRAFAWGGHVDKVRNYFGERIGLYFLFMSHLNKWLVWPAIVGALFWLVDLFSGTPDNYLAVPMCLGVGVWGVLFVHMWRRKQAAYALRWGTLDTGSQLEPTRPEFRGVSRINPVTGRSDRYYPWSERIKRVMFSWSVLFFALCVLAFAVACLAWTRHVFHRHGGRLLFQVLNAVAVEALNAGFTRVARRMTDFENHRAYSEYSSHLLAKTVIFKFVNCYISLYYIAFVKAHSALFGTKMDCVGGDCLNDLGSQLAIFMIMRLTLQNFVELGLPYLTMWYRGFAEGRTFHTSLFTNPLTVMPDLSSAERQSKKEDYDVHEDMDEILILYGYTTLFVVACPWVPLLALLSSVLECFLDQKKLVLLYRRPFPMPAGNNEPWDTAFDVFGILAMLTNAAIVIFVSEGAGIPFLGKFADWQHRSKIFFFLAVEHAIIFARVAFSLLAPSMPRNVRLLRMQQQVVLHKHLDLGGEEDDAETRDSAMRTSMSPPPHVYDQDEDEF